MKRDLELRFSQLTNQVIGVSPSLPKLRQKIEVVDCTIKDQPSPLSRVM